MQIGEIITFGKFKWRVLDIKKDGALILTESIAEQRDYHSKPIPITWKDCELRHYLNGEFLQQFSKEEQDRICSVQHENPGNSWYGTDGGENTTDFVFLLSMDEVVRLYFGDSSRLLDEPARNQRYWFQRKDSNNEKRRATFLDDIWWWWTRTPGKNQKVAVYVHGDGNIGIQGNGVAKRNTNIIHPLTNSNGGGVRPAMWIKVTE